MCVMRPLRPMIRKLACQPLFDMRLRCAETAEQIELLFGVETRGNPRHAVLYGPRYPFFYHYVNSNSNSKTVISIASPTIHVKTDGA